jgi:benzoate/toluate 1,2-dioxygenase subunit beta
MSVDRQQVEEFILLEGDLADEHRFDEWETLWTDDALYWVPASQDEPDPNRAASIIYDNRARIASRIRRLKSGAAWAQDPPSRMRRVISVLRMEEAENDEITVFSNFVLAEVRAQNHNLWSGRIVHRLRRENGSFKIAMKKILLLNSDEALPTLGFLL